MRFLKVVHRIGLIAEMACVVYLGLKPGDLVTERKPVVNEFQEVNLR